MLERVEISCGSIRGATMNQQHQRILFVFTEIGRIDEDAVLVKAIRTLPLEAVHLPELQCGDLLIEIRQPLRWVRARRHVIKLRWLRGGAAGEGGLAFWSNRRIDPEQPGGIYLAQRQFARFAFERLQPQGNPRAVVPADQQNTAA